MNININYRLPATLGDVINITTEIEKIGNTSMTFAQKMYKNGTEQLICDAAITFVILDQKTEKPLKIDDNLKSLFYKEVSK